MCETIEVSPLGKTWILDLDGTIVKHNGYKPDGKDSLLPGIEGFLSQIQPDDMVIFVTSRTEEYRAMTEKFLREAGIRYDHLICGAPFGERIVVNDRKSSGLSTALAVNTERDVACTARFEIDSTR